MTTPTKYMHLHVVCLILEGNVVLLLFIFIHNIVIMFVIDECIHLYTVMLHLHLFAFLTSVIVMLWICRQFIGGKD